MKPQDGPVAVVTSAVSAIGRETALRMARRGAWLVLSGRDQRALDELALHVRGLGGRAHAVLSGESDPRHFEGLAGDAVRVFGRIDVWVHLSTVSDPGFARIVESDLMGPVHGTRAALEHMRRAGRGTVICVGPPPAPGRDAWLATWHAMRGFVDAVREELRRDRADIKVKLLLPASADGGYAPSRTAEAIVAAAVTPVRWRRLRVPILGLLTGGLVFGAARLGVLWRRRRTGELIERIRELSAQRAAHQSHRARLAHRALRSTPAELHRRPLIPQA